MHIVRNKLCVIFKNFCTKNNLPCFEVLKSSCILEASNFIEIAFLISSLFERYNCRQKKAETGFPLVGSVPKAHIKAVTDFISVCQVSGTNTTT